MIIVSMKWRRKLAILIEILNSFQKFICIIKSKKFIFIKLMISDLIVSITICSIVFSTIFALMIVFFVSNSTTIFDLMIDSKHDFVDVDVNEIDREKINFELFEIDIEFELTTKKIFNWITISNFDSIEIKLELKSIVNFSKLNDLKNLLNLILKRDLKLTTTSTIFNSIVF